MQSENANRTIFENHWSTALSCPGVSVETLRVVKILILTTLRVTLILMQNHLKHKRNLLAFKAESPRVKSGFR